MADQQQSSGASTNTFYKGMMKDYNESYIGNDMWTHARNAVNNSHDGNTYVIGNEPSNLKCITLNYTMIGCIHLLDDQWIIFSTDDTDSEIGIFDESACTYEPLKNKNGDDIEFGCLNLKKTNLITGAFRRRYDCERIIYWDDGLNPTRTMDIDNVPCLQDCVTNSNCTTCVDTIYINCEAIRIAPIVKHPCINISKGKLSGTLPNGSYQVAIAYTVNQVKVTDYIGLSEVQGIWSHENTSGSIDINITNIDDSFDEFELIVLSNINAQTVCKRIGYYNTSRGDIYLDRWDPEFNTVSANEVVYRSEPIEKSDAMYTVNNYLLRIGTYSKFKFNYQPLANQIISKWTVVEYPQNYYQRGGNITGYMRDEVYAFFIRFVYNTGEFSESYHIPGRAILPNDTSTIAGPDVYEATNLPRWKVYNTATFDIFNSYPLNDGSGGIATSQGDMSYWESEEKYPSDRFDIWGNLCGQPIRHHKMPDESIGTNGQLNLFNPVTNNIRILGVKFDNIQPPVDNQGNVITTIVGYEILRSSREGNKSIIAKGLINNMREYTIPNNRNTGLFINYPYNDLHPDSYLADAGNTPRPTGSNGREDGNVYTNNKMDRFSKNKFSFHSPDTTFSRPYLNINSSELKLYNEHVGKSNGMFQPPYRHPHDKAPSAFIGYLTDIMTALNTIDTISQVAGPLSGTDGGNEVQFTGTEEFPVNFTYSFPPFPDWPSINLADAYGVSAWIGFALALVIYILEIAIWVTITLALIVLTTALNDIKLQRIYKIFYAMIPQRMYAAQYVSHGYYNNYNYINTPDNKRRQITLANYVGAGVQQFGLTHQINNINRGTGAIVLQLGSDIQSTNNDDSRVVISEANGVGYNDFFARNIASYYAAIKIPMASQYGQLESIKQIPVSTCIRSIASKSTGRVPLFGGDVYINRFTEKNTFFFFNNWLLGQPDMFEFNYTKYINIPYPRYWRNSEEWKVHFFSFPADQRSFDNVTTGGGIDLGFVKLDTYVDNGYYYLFNSGVRDFFCEAEVNVAYRDYEDELQKRFYDPYGFADITGETGIFRSNPEIITAGNYYKYDYSLSKSKLFNSHITWGETLPRDYNPLVAESCYVYRPNRVMYSLPQQDGSKKDNWRAFLPNNFKDFSSKVSSIKPINKTGALFMMKYANPLMFMGVEELKLSDSGTKITIGDGGLFTGVQQLQAVVNSDESYEYGSNQSRFSAVNCLHGVFWVSQNQGKVFQYGGGSSLQEISAGGMRWWFAKYLPSELLKKYPNYPHYDNPVMGIGTQMIYDNTHELIYITKKDYIAKDCGQTLNYNGNFINTVQISSTPTCPSGYTLQNGVCVPNIPDCPVGYTYDAQQNTCVQTQNSAGILNSNLVNLTRTPYHAYGYSTRVHNTASITAPFTTLNTGNPFWNFNFSLPQTQAAQLNNGPANRLSVWGLQLDNNGLPINNYTPGGNDVPPTGQWIGFEVCLDIPENKTYWVSLFGDNRYRVRINGTTVLEDSNGSDTFNFLHFYPLALPAGSVTLAVEGFNSGALAGFGCEIFDLTSVATTPAQVVTYLNAQTNYTNLDPLTIFTTRNQTTFTTNLYVCPSGFNTISSDCNGAVCQRTVSVAPTYTAIPATIPVQTIPSDWDNKECWEEISWTISYDPKIKAWVSFHDWIPSFLIPGKAHFMSVAPESGSIVDSIWKHNIRCDSYANYYGVDYPFEIEFVSATGQTVNSMRSIEYLLEAYNYSNDCRDKFHNLYENFDQAIVYNSEQNSGLLKLNLHVKNDPLALLAYPKINTALGYIDIQYSKVENKYRFNQFWDITKDRGQALPSPLNIPMFNTNGNGYVYPINPAYVNYAKSPLEHKKFRHNVNRVFLRRLVCGNNKFLFKISNQKTLQSLR